MRQTYVFILIISMFALPIHLYAMNNMNETNNYPMVVNVTDDLITYDVTECRLDLACGQMPDTTMEDVILCTAAAFTGKCLDYFEHTNILGPHISNNVLYEGYDYDEHYALFAAHGKEKGIYNLPNPTILEQVLKEGGMAFTQHWVIKDRKIYTPTIQKLEEQHHYRSMCIKEGRVYVVASKEKVPYQDYLNMLITFGIENALYMDMGRGWNHSFYRDENGQVHIIHPKTHNYCTNWLTVFRVR